MGAPSDGTSATFSSTKLQTANPPSPLLEKFPIDHLAVVCRRQEAVDSSSQSFILPSVSSPVDQVNSALVAYWPGPVHVVTGPSYRFVAPPDADQKNLIVIDLPAGDQPRDESSSAGKLLSFQNVAAMSRGNVLSQSSRSRIAAAVTSALVKSSSDQWCVTKSLNFLVDLGFSDR